GAKPASLQLEGPVATRHQRGLDLLELARNAFIDRSTPDRETAVLGLPAHVREAEEVERLGATEATLRALLRGEPPEADQARLLGVERQAEHGQALLQVFPEALGVGLMLKPQHEVSRREGSHLPALAEPDVNLSTHPAPIVQPSGRRPQRQCA